MDKFCFPTIPPSRLQSLVTHSFNWQHSLCERRLPNVAMATLLTDHNCSELMLPPSLMSESLLHRPVQNFTPLPSLSLSLGRSSFELTSHFTADPSRLAIDVRGAANDGESSRQESMHLDSQNIYSIAPAKRIRASESSTSVRRLLPLRSLFESAHQIVPRKSDNMEKLPTSLVMELRLDSAVVSMDFHPIQQTLLLGVVKFPINLFLLLEFVRKSVGTSSGEVSIWDVSSKERIHKKCFGLLNNAAFSAVIQDALDKEDGFFSVRRVLWSTDGCHFVVAYCKHLVQMYKISGKRDSLQCAFEIDAHKGGLNDITFSRPPVFIVTSGDDGAIRVWCSTSGLRLHTFGGDHSAPVLSICLRLGGFHQDIISASSDGKIKSWRFDKNLEVEPEHEFEGPICSSVSLAATTDGSRLFSCGTIKDVGTGSPFLVEWGELNEGIIKCYLGLSTHTDEALQFDMADDHILAIGDDSIVKFWNVDNREPLYYVDAGGGLPTFPRIRFNNSGLLAVSAKDNFIKILASRSDQEMLSPSHLPLTAETSSHTSVATVESVR
ncbi:topless-related protein 1-like [Carex rostrata]